MVNKFLLSTFFMLFISLNGFAIGNIDICESNDSSGFCIFISFAIYPDDTVFFHCTTKKSTEIEMESNDVLISGFSGSRKTGKGKLTLSGKKAMKMLNSHYFKVQLNPVYHNYSTVFFFADKDIVCETGKGKNTTQMVGELD